MADYLDSKKMIAEYLNTVLEEGDNADVINAVGDIAKVIEMTKNIGGNRIEQTQFVQSIVRRRQTSICDHPESFEGKRRTNSSEPDVHLRK